MVKDAEGFPTVLEAALDAPSHGPALLELRTDPDRLSPDLELPG